MSDDYISSMIDETLADASDENVIELGQVSSDFKNSFEVTYELQVHDLVFECNIKTTILHFPKSWSVFQLVEKALQNNEPLLLIFDEESDLDGIGKIFSELGLERIGIVVNAGKAEVCNFRSGFTKKEIKKLWFSAQQDFMEKLAA